MRAAVGTPSAHNVPLRRCAIEAVTALNMTWTCPAIMSASAGGSPR